jgi:hypothetical protein
VTPVTPVTPDPLRYGRLRLDGDLDQFHHAINALKADTCERGQCDPGGRCTKHQRKAAQRLLRAVPDQETA